MRTLAVAEAMVCGLLGGTVYVGGDDSAAASDRTPGVAEAQADQAANTDVGDSDRSELDSEHAWLILQKLPAGAGEGGWLRGEPFNALFFDLALGPADLGALGEAAKGRREVVADFSADTEVPAPSSVLVLSGIALLIPGRHRPRRRGRAQRA